MLYTPPRIQPPAPTVTQSVPSVALSRPVAQAPWGAVTFNAAQCRSLIWQANRGAWWTCQNAADGAVTWEITPAGVVRNTGRYYRAQKLYADSGSPAANATWQSSYGANFRLATQAGFLSVTRANAAMIPAMGIGADGALRIAERLPGSPGRLRIRRVSLPVSGNPAVLSTLDTPAGSWPYNVTPATVQYGALGLGAGNVHVVSPYSIKAGVIAYSSTGARLPDLEWNPPVALVATAMNAAPGSETSASRWYGLGTDNRLYTFTNNTWTSPTPARHAAAITMATDSAESMPSSPTVFTLNKRWNLTVTAPPLTPPAFRAGIYLWRGAGGSPDETTLARQGYTARGARSLTITTPVYDGPAPGAPPTDAPYDLVQPELPERPVSPWPDVAVETPPTVWLEAPDSAFGRRAVATWTLERELVWPLAPGGSAAGGLSVGTATLTLAQDPARPFTPWSPRSDRRVTTGSQVDLYAAKGDPENPDTPRMPLGAWQLAPQSGALTDTSISVELIEAHYRARTQPAAPPVVTDVEPAAIAFALAVQAAFLPAIEVLGGTLPAPWVPSDADALTALQDLVTAWCGAVFVDNTGVLRVRSRETLAGLDATTIDLDVGRYAEDLAWSLDPADVPDRLEVTYTPAATLTSFEVDCSPEAIMVPARSSIDITVALDTSPLVVADWIDITNNPATNPNPTDPIFAANSRADGNNGVGVAGVLRVATVSVSTSRMILRLTNPSAQPLWVVDGNGSPCLFLRAQGYPAETERVTSRGLPAEASDASRIRQVDLGRYVQRQEDAEDIADYYWARLTAGLWKADSVRVKPDWARDLGDVVRLRHGRTSLNQRAMVTKIAWSGQAGEVTQTLDLALLPSIWAEFDEAWAGRTWDDFDALWAAYTWDDFDRVPTATTSAQIGD